MFLKWLLLIVGGLSIILHLRLHPFIINFSIPCGVIWLEIKKKTLWMPKFVYINFQVSRLVDKSWSGQEQNNRPKKKGTHKIRLARSKRRKIDQYIPSNEFLSRKIIKVEFPIHCGVVELKEWTLGPFTCFTLSTMIRRPWLHHWITFIVRPR